MKISAELFLLDNALMNLCIILLASALSGIRIRLPALLLFSLGGAVYAFLSMFYVPWLRSVPIKLVSFAALTIPLFERGTSFWTTGLSVLLSAALVGGVVALFTILTGGQIRAEGSIVGTVRLRTALLGLALALVLPRGIRALLRQHKLRGYFTDIVVQLPNELVRCRALIDTGNALVEPISGLPIVLLQDVTVSQERAVVYHTQGGTNILFAARPQKLTLPQYGNAAVDCYIARAMQPIPGAKAILPIELIPNEWRKCHAATMETTLGPDSDPSENRKKKRVLVYSYRREFARAARHRGGGALHRGSTFRKVGKGQTDSP